MEQRLSPTAPGKSRAHDLAIEREKQRHAAGVTTGTPQAGRKTPEKPQKEQESPRMQTVRSIENKIHKQNFESAAIVDDNGNQLFFKDGSYSEVRFSRSECMQMRNNTMIHNHPRCNMFSWEDLACMVTQQVYETRIVNRDGTVYSMKQAAGGYSTEKARAFVKAYEKEYLRGTMHAQRDLDSRGFQDKLWKNEITQDEANIEFGRSCAKYMADYAAREAPKYGLEFSVETKAVKKSWEYVMKTSENKEDDYLVLDHETNDLEDKAFNEWLGKHGLQNQQTAKSFSDVLNSPN